MIPLKSEKDLEALRISGQILSRVMQELKRHLQINVQTLELDRLAAELIAKEGAVAAFKGYKGFPSNICVSINEEIVHGIPSERRLNDADIVSLDLGVNYKGYFSDAAITVTVGNADVKAVSLIDVTKEALRVGVDRVRVNNRVSDISYAIQEFVEKHGFSVVRQFVGHGIGFALHEEPEIPNFGQPHKGAVIKEGMVFAVEPMVNMGGYESEILDNGWTAVTIDRLPSAHFEYTVAVTKNGPEVLTQFVLDP